MIVGVGVDMVDTRRISRSLDRFGDRFVRKILASNEIRPHLSGIQAAAYLARQFAAKEAVSKALGSGMKSGVHFRNIRVLRAESGAPIVLLNGGALDRASTLNVTQVHLSMSDERDYALAYAIAVTD